MAHWNIARVERAKNKLIDRIDESFEWEELKKKVRKDARKMSRGQLSQKWPKPLIDEALKEEVANVR